MKHSSKMFDTSTLQGLKAAERFKARLNDAYESVTVYRIGWDRVQITGKRPIGREENHGQAPDVVPVCSQRNV